MAGKNDVTALRKRLEELLRSLEHFDKNLEGDFGSLDMAWVRLDQVWGGQAYETFHGSWDGMRQTLKEYNGTAHQYERFLRERIDALIKYEQGDAL